MQDLALFNQAWSSPITFTSAPVTKTESAGCPGCPVWLTSSACGCLAWCCAH